jgi:hypothetical protein
MTAEVEKKQQAEMKKLAACQKREEKKLSNLRFGLLRKATGSYQRSSTPKSWRFAATGITAALSAALMDQSKGVDLATVVKNGAYYTIRGYA